MTTIDVVSQAKTNFLLAEEFMDFKEYISYKLDMNSREFEEMYEEFIKWSNGEITIEEIKQHPPMSGTEEQVWEGLSQLDDKYFLEEYHPSYFKVKEGMEEDHNKLRDAMEFIEKQEEQSAALKEALREFIPLTELMRIELFRRGVIIEEASEIVDRAKLLIAENPIENQLSPPQE